MQSNDLAALIAIRVAGEFNQKQPGCSGEVSIRQVSHLRDELVSGGYISPDNPRKYQLSDKGRNALLEEALKIVNCNDEIWVKYRIRKLEQLFSEIHLQLNNLVLNVEEHSFFLAK